MRTRFEAPPYTSGPEFEERPQQPEYQSSQPESDQHISTAEQAEALGSLSVVELMRQVEIDERTVVRFARQSPTRVNSALHTAETYAQFTPAVASAIARHNEPSIEQIHPTADEIKQQQWDARFVSGFLGMFSSRWADRFDRHLESKAKQKLTFIASRTSATVDAIGDIARPKEQFISELTTLYNRAAHDPSQRNGLLRAVEHAASGLNDENEAEADKEKESNPRGLLYQLNHLTGLTRRADRMSVRAATPEIMQGVERFLKKQNAEVTPLQTVEKPTMARRLVQRLRPQKLATLPEQIEATLASIYSVLPADGQRFKEGIYAICKNITIRAQQGESGQDITRKLVKEVQDFIQQGHDKL